MDRQPETTQPDREPDEIEYGPPGSGIKRAGWFLFKILLLFGGLFLALLIGLSLLSTGSTEGLSAFRHTLERLDSVMVYLRLAAIAGVIGFWRPLNVWLAQRKGWSQAHLQRVLDGRWLTLGVLLFVELVLIQRLHEPLIDSIRG
jgi:hypothetical protein